MFHGSPFKVLKMPAGMAAVVILAGLEMVMGGCQQYATYPPVEVTARMQRPAAEPVPTIIADAVLYARDNFVGGQALPINLPEEVPATVYEKVFTHLDGGRPMQIPGERAIHITEVRTRAMHAQVDMMYPTPKGFYQFVTLTLERSVLESWRVKSERKWAMRDVRPPTPNFVPPPPTDEPQQQTAQVGGS